MARFIRPSMLLRNLFAKRALDRDLSAELAAHVQLLADEKMEQGMPRERAQREALVELGGVEQVKEEVRASRGGAWLDSLAGDVRFAIRVLLRKPTFAAFAILTLTVGIGANAALFSIVHAVLLRSLPFRHGDRLVMVWSAYNTAGTARVPASGPELTELRARSRTLEELAGIWSNQMALVGDGEPEQVKIGFVTANFFSTLGADAELGRTFRPEEEGFGSPPTAVISHGLWVRRFGADPGIVGRTVRTTSGNVTVVGVMPANFHMVFPPDASVPSEIEAWVPFRESLAAGRRDQAYLRLVGRLAPGVTPAQAQAELSSIAAKLRSEFQEFSVEGLDYNVIGFRDDSVRDFRPALLALFAGVGLILLICCTNVSSLLLARLNERQREITIRSAIGATRARLLRQLMTESLVLAVLGGAGGLALGYALLRVYPALRPDDALLRQPVQMNLPVFGFVLLITSLSAVVFGIAPAMACSRLNLAESLGEGARATGRGRRFRAVLIAAEVMLGVVLLLGAGLMLRTFVNLLRVDPGFQAEHRLTFLLALPQRRYADDAKASAFMRDVRSNLAHLPGVRAVGASSHIPFGDAPNWYSNYWPTGATAEQQNSLLADHRSITPGFFASMGVPLIAGRDFTDTDDAAHPRVVIVDEKLANETWPGQNPIGQRLNVEIITRSEFTRDWAEVIGVVRHVSFQSLTHPVRGQVYQPFAQCARWQMVYVVNSDGAYTSLLPAIRREVAELDAEMPVASVVGLDSYLEHARAKTRAITIVAALLAGIALLLTCVGIYGIANISVVQRTNEIGVRMALGATRGNILRLVLSQAMRPVLLGLVLGTGTAFALTPMLSALLFGVEPFDGATFMGTALLLAATALLAAYAPARRAVGIDPVAALRHE